MKKAIVTAALLVSTTIGLSWSQTEPYPYKIHIPVIYYDFHPNGMNDFEMCTGQVTQGMVQSTLDADLKPIPTAVANPVIPTVSPCACHLTQWFRVSGQVGLSDPSLKFFCDSSTNQRRWYWASSAQAKFPGDLRPYTVVNPWPGEYVGLNFDPNSITANVVIYDSLEFNYNPGLQMYTISNDYFFPLDNRGFGTEPANQNPPHNFGFTMELHTVFTYQHGQVFKFSGDDDLWVYINGQLVIDLGGLHTKANATVNLDTLPLIVGKRYSFDLFYAERHSTGSHLQITTNCFNPEIIFPSDPQLKAQFFPDRDTLTAGDSMICKVYRAETDSLGHPYWDSVEVGKNLVWGLVKPAHSESYLSFPSGVETRSATSIFHARTAYEIDTIKISYNLPNGNVAQYEKKLFIKPAWASKLVIMADTVMSSHSQIHIVPTDTIKISSTMTTHSIYAGSIDPFGNLLGLRTDVVWSSCDTAIVKVIDGPSHATDGQAIIQRMALKGSAKICGRVGSATDTAEVVLLTDTIIVAALKSKSNPSLPSYSTFGNTFHYTLPSPGFVTVRYFDVRGRLILTLVNSSQSSGVHQVKIPTGSLAKGSYIQEFRVGEFVKKERVAFVR
jgi:fibro-slime domain-containing protein